MSGFEALRLALENGICLGVAGADLILDAEREPAPAVLEAIRRNKAEIVALLVADHVEWTAEDWKAFFDERAGIAEFDGARSRGYAEALAFDCCVAEWLNRNFERSPPSRCLACGGGDRAHDAPPPRGIEPTGHAWLHSRCKAEAVAALKAMGIVLPPKFPDDFGKNGGA